MAEFNRLLQQRIDGSLLLMRFHCQNLNQYRNFIYPDILMKPTDSSPT